MKQLEDLYKNSAKNGKSTIAVACANDDQVLTSVFAAKEMAHFILVGDSEKIHRISYEIKLDISDMEIIDVADNVKACQTAVSLVVSGASEALMKGLVDTSVIMKAVLDKEAGMRTDKILSHLALFAVPNYHKLLFVTDAAINIAPDISAKKSIIQNAAKAVANLGVPNPKVALLSAKEKVDPKIPSSIDAAELVNQYKNGEIQGCIVDGPLALDNAVSKESAEIKGINSEIAGDADILVCPDIASGNILYKALSFLAGAKNGGVVLGAKKPIILTSRADSAESKLISIAMGILS